MVDVSSKSASSREAHARTTISLPDNVALELKAQGSNPTELVGPKGPIFATAVIAGVMGAKKTSDLIPFCHPLPIDSCKITIEMARDNEIVIDCRVKVHHKTGVEMEAMTGSSVAALCVYDMCKALSHDIVIKETRLVHKSK
jgi:cyclic pyranopterin phosphate synthase